MNVSFPGLRIDFDINRVAFSFGSVSVYWYGILIATGLVLACVYAFTRAKYFNVDKDKLLNVVIVGVICAIVGARLYFVAFKWEDYRDNPIEIFYINKGGLAIYGGLIGAIIGGGICCKIQKLSFFSTLDIASIGFLIGQGIGRWGNFFNQEAFGTETDLPWRMVSENTGNVGVHPCFLYESIWCLLGVLVLHIISKRWYNFKGQIFLCYMVWYGFERMLVEGLRTDSLYLPFGIFGYTPRVSQVLSAAIFLTGIILLIVFRNNKNFSNKNKEKNSLNVESVKN